MAMMNRILLLVMTVMVVFLTGCASVPMASVERDNEAKTFAVKADKSNIYIYRNESFGAAVKMEVLLDGNLIGQTAAQTYFRLEVPPGQHTLISKAENDDVLNLNTEAGKNYFVWQEVKMGLLYARTMLHLSDEVSGKTAVSDCKLVENLP